MAHQILVVDDNDIDRRLVSRRLKRQDYDVISVASGEEAIAFLRDHQVDLVLLDIMMTGLSGIGVLKHIRHRYKPVELPVIMVTAKDESQDIVEALSLGANDYINKPLNIEVTLARIETQLNLSQFYRDSLRMKEIEALNAMIITYNHEINGPLSVASAEIAKYLETNQSLQRASESLKRIEVILNKIDQITSSKVNYIDYGPSESMIDLNETDD